MKEIVNINNVSYKIEYETPLTPEQMNSVYEQIENMNGCNTCNNPQTLGTIYTLANMVSNPSIETDPNTGPTYSNYAEGSAIYSWASDAYNTGLRSLKIVSPAAAGVMSRWTAKYVAVTAGNQYYTSAYLKTSNVTGYANVTVTWWNGIPSGTTYISSSLSTTTINGTKGFIKIEVNPKAPTGAKYARMEFRLYGPGTLWIDDVSFDTLETDVTPCPTVKMGAGDVLELATTTTGGTPPYTVTFKKNATTLPSGTFTGIGEGIKKTYQYTILSTDYPSVKLETTVTDSCSTPLPCSKSCTVNLTTAECSTPVCDFTVTKVG